MRNLATLFAKTDNGLVGTDCREEDFTKLEIISRQLGEVFPALGFNLIEEALELIAKVVGGKTNNNFMNWLLANYDNGNSGCAFALDQIVKYLNGDIAAKSMVTMISLPYDNSRRTKRVNLTLPFKEDRLTCYDLGTFIMGAGPVNAINFFTRFDWNKPEGPVVTPKPPPNKATSHKG